jgi:chitinase
MDAVTFISKLQKFIRDSYQNIGDAMISGTVDSMEKYKYMQGQANAYQTVIQEISNLLNKKEQNDEKGNVIDLGNGKGSSKDKPRS